MLYRKELDRFKKQKENDPRKNVNLMQCENNQSADVSTGDVIN